MIISPEEATANAPPTPQSGIVAGRPTTERAEQKLVLQNAAERTLEPAALQLTTFLHIYIFHNRSIVADLFVQSS